MRLGLFIRRMALNWTLSRRCREDLETPPQTCGQYPQRRMNLRFVYTQQLRRSEKATGSREKAKFLRCMFSNGVDVDFQERLDDT